MRINHKSDFDFRLDLYAADPYGTAVAAGFPDCDFTGKLFIGPSARSRQCYSFSKSGKRLVNCFDSDGHLHVVVSGHNLAPGPLYCELTLRVADSHYPGGYRSVVYSFPLNLYLTDSDAEQISPTVSVTLPVMQKVICKPPALDDPTDAGNDSETEEVVPSNRANTRFTEPWLSPRVCSGTIRTGSYVGNIYRNDKGRIMLSGHKDVSPNGSTLQTIYLPQIMNLGIDGLTLENLVSSIRHCSAQPFTHSFHDNHITLEYHDCNLFPGYYLEIKKTPYVAIAPDGSLKYLTQCPKFDYKPKPVTLEEVIDHSNTYGSIFILEFESNYVFQMWGKRKRAPVKKEGMQNFLIWKKLKVPIKKWISKKKIQENATKKPLFFRVAHKKHGVVSDWLYFKVLYNYATCRTLIIKTDENGAKIGNDFIVI